MKILKLITPFTLFILSLVNLKAQSIDRSRSLVRFEVMNMEIEKVNGSFSGLSGEVRFNKDEPENTRMRVIIPVHTVSTNNIHRDGHLKQEDYFDYINHPEILFSSTKAEKSTDGFRIEGNLTIKGITKEVSIPFKYFEIKAGYLIKGSLVIDRLDYKIGQEGSFLAGREITLSIECYLKS